MAKTFSKSDQKKLQLENQINLLNDLIRYKVGPSEIHGVGVIALVDIKKGEKLNMDSVFHQFDLPYKKFNKLEPHVRQHILERFPLVTQGSHFIYPDAKMSAFCNHSDEPNYDNQTDLTLKKIPKGTEITEDYRNILGYELVYTWLKK